MHDATPETLLVDELPAARRCLRVACVTETYPPEVNGVAMTIARVVEGLHRRQHSVQLVRPRQPARGQAGNAGDIDEVLTRGLPIPRYPQLRMGMPSRRELVRLWSLQRPDVVHVATEGPLGWSAVQAARHLRLPTSSDFRTNFHPYSRHYGVAWLQRPILAWLRKFHNATGATMVPTRALERELSAQGFQRLAVVARGVDTERFDPQRRDPALRQEWGASDTSLVVLCVGRLAAEKNLLLAVEAFEALAPRHGDARLVFVGDGPLREELARRCPRAFFAGRRDGLDLAAHYASADLFLFPSLTETFGNVTPEAMASGLPVLAFDDAAAAALIRSGHNGVLVPCGDPSEYVRTAVALAASAELRRAIAAQARSTALTLGWDRILDQFESVLDSVMAHGPVRKTRPAAALPRTA